MERTTGDSAAESAVAPGAYQPPDVTYLGTVAELTQQGVKEVGGADGATFLGIDIGS